MISIRYPIFRAMVIEYLRRFADAQWIERVWLNHTAKEMAAPVDGYDVAIAELWNSLGVYPDPADSVGWVLASTEEAVLLKEFFGALDEFSKRYPSPTLTKEMTHTEEWQSVQRAARAFIKSLEPESNITAGSSEDT